MNKINHLSGISSQFIETDRLRMHVLTAGLSENPPILFLHGNTSSSTIWEAVMLQFAENYYCVAPDMRGFGETEKKLIDATRGIGDWLDDLKALIEVLDLAPLHLVGHSLGGFVCWGMIAECIPDIDTVTLIAPGPPMGFGGIHGEKGIPNNTDYSGSGGGIVVQKFAENVKAGDRSAKDPMYSPRNVMNRLFWKQGFKAEREEDFLTSMLQIHTGEKQYPGDYIRSDFWPHVAPGNYGPVNAISPKYNQSLLKDFVDTTSKPPLLWIHGADDNIISDTSFSDPGYQGKMKLREGWPGDQEYPPQPMETQIKYALAAYQDKGGEVYHTTICDCGHTPFIEKPERTKRALLNHIQEKPKANKKF